MVSMQSEQSILEQNTNEAYVKTTVGYIFSEYAHCDMLYFGLDMRKPVFRVW